MKKRILKIFLSLIIIFFVIFSFLFYKISSYLKLDEARKVDVIIVLGASQWNGEPSPVFKARLDQAYFLYSEKMADNLILTGGIGDDAKISEAEVAKNYLINKGIDAENIFFENTGRTSWQSLNNVIKILEQENFENVLLVSDGFHMFRLKKMTKDLGIEAYVSPAKDSPIAKNKFIEFKYILREIFVFVVYFLFEI